MEKMTTPEHYLLMLGRFRKNVNTYADPMHAFKAGTPKWMIDEWVDFTSSTVIE